MIAWVIETFVATTLLMLLVLVIRKPVGRHFGPNIAYALWALPVLRMFMPPLPGAWQFTDLIAPLTRGAEESPGVVMGVLNADKTPQAIIDNAVLQAHVELASGPANVAAVPPTLTPDGPGIVLLIIGIWVAGAIAFLAWHLIAHNRFCARLLRRARIERTVAEGRVHVIETDAATGPLAFGIWRKYVAFPRDFSERYDPLERNLALAHELGHHLRGDLIANWIALVVLALHWFNPVAWRAFRAFRADQEMACDALVLSGRAPALRHAYGRAIVKSAHGGAVSAACHLHTINELKGRLRMLSKHDRKSRARITAGVTGAAALTLAGLALTASGTQAAANLRADVGDAIGVDLQDAPAAPTAPEAPDAPEALDAPAAVEAPDAPEAPKAKKVERRVMIIEKDKDGKKREVRVIHAPGDGKSFVWSGDKSFVWNGDMHKLARVPAISSIKCGAPKDGDIKIESKDGDKHKIVICADRIEARVDAATHRAAIARARAERGKAIAIASAEMGKRQAMMGLKMARRSIEAQDALSAEQKAAALKGIDEAIRELKTADDED
ncbi:M56 family metallopeptidase [Sphingomonas sp. BT-65]|uniref:M56 family metallopeptidase n=1 Tax=Sphingomonas sp. BT-65 TaxID=2989821 RepID=UPI0022356A44|nr:M56 family metallopeptidase [Sphingomonas sp. BT-65]MCW4460399.1 M56 family metallopeptidase [Sphingomonas sp. BT-65]